MAYSVASSHSETRRVQTIDSSPSNPITVASSEGARAFTVNSGSSEPGAASSLTSAPRATLTVINLAENDSIDEPVASARSYSTISSKVSTETLDLLEAKEIEARRAMEAAAARVKYLEAKARGSKS